MLVIISRVLRCALGTLELLRAQTEEPDLCVVHDLLLLELRQPVLEVLQCLCNRNLLLNILLLRDTDPLSIAAPIRILNCWLGFGLSSCTINTHTDSGDRDPRRAAAGITDQVESETGTKPVRPGPDGVCRSRLRGGASKPKRTSCDSATRTSPDDGSDPRAPPGFTRAPLRGD
ncbi:hypothetical protein EYF80_004721 [Liparis tanakae]|uniref:Uncharacterized protein n=1 Tax=Liparis tanakae TaxID=230148 RepID=A0A4Z2J4X8_9TELE|nr:hypothetical protein EYF80_004721 [Liparis tanakae]